jgi:hypothetical protein
MITLIKCLILFYAMNLNFNKIILVNVYIKNVGLYFEELYYLYVFISDILIHTIKFLQLNVS